MFEGFHAHQTVPNLEKLIKEQQASIDKMAVEIESLQEENSKLRTLNMLLQESLVRNREETTLTEVEGYPKKEWLLSVSQNAENSDYLFVKELLLRLFPQGVGNATTSGRPSNNPKGRNKGDGEKDHFIPQTNKLDPDKVAYMKDRLYERRLILQDPVGIAMEKSKMVNKHIANVIANTPTLRKSS
nr:uncharacterized protein LOC115258773 [Aedes albopictus]